jgi:hypothetical protein
MRLGEVVFKISYVVDIDDSEMIDRASIRIVRDMSDILEGKLSMGRFAEVITDNERWFDERDIQDFLKEEK